MATHPSGNHGGSQAGTANVQNLMAVPTPTQSQNAFVAPDTILKKTPSIKNLIHEQPQKQPEAKIVTNPNSEAQKIDVATIAEESISEKVQTSTQKETQVIVETQPVTETQPLPEKKTTTDSEIPATTNNVTTIPNNLSAEESINPENNDDLAKDNAPSIGQPNSSASTGISVNDNEQFLKIWHNMIDVVYADVPTVYYTLKDIVPTKENDIINLKLTNDLQADDFNIRKLEALRILRESDNSINDINTTIGVDSNTKKYIIDDADKIAELKRQNADFEDFVKTLELSILN